MVNRVMSDVGLTSLDMFSSCCLFFSSLFYVCVSPRHSLHFHCFHGSVKDHDVSAQVKQYGVSLTGGRDTVKIFEAKFRVVVACFDFVSQALY